MRKSSVCVSPPTQNSLFLPFFPTEKRRVHPYTEKQLRQVCITPSTLCCQPPQAYFMLYHWVRTGHFMSDFPPPSSALPVFVAVSEQAEHWANTKRLRGPWYPGGGTAGRFEKKPVEEGVSAFCARWLLAGLLHRSPSLLVGNWRKQTSSWWPAGKMPQLNEVAFILLL